MRLLLVDNYDSFTHNLAHRLAEAGAEPLVRTNDTPLDRLPLDAVAGIVLSPGPGRPDRPADFGVCRALIERARVPLLGVCLGHQGIGLAFGARLVETAPMHGRLSTLRFADDPLFAGVRPGARVVRYHSLALVDLPPPLTALARAEDGVLMALRHAEKPIWGVQFHPESICTEDGGRLLANFVGLCGAPERVAVSAARRAPKPTHRLAYEAVRRAAGAPIDPEAAYVALFHGRRGAFWLDSAGGGRHVLGAAGPEGAVMTHRVDEQPPLFDRLAAALETTRIAPDPGRPFPFAGGLVGYLGYGLKAECGAPPGPPDRHPDAVLIRAERFVVIDGPRAWVAAVEPVGGDPEAAAWRGDMARRLADLPDPGPPGPPCAEPPVFRADRGPARYRADIAACMAELRAGESYEICLTTHLRAATAVDPLAFHRRLRRSNPAPHAALLELDGLAVVSASPERFLRVGADGAVEAKPIKGTRARGVTPAEDERLRRELGESEKDRAENLMICDLLRNDLARVCAPGSVRVPRLMHVERYATVHQLVSTVTGRLRPEATAVHCARAAFPGGSMTGAPKLRTMAIIDRLEGAPRGVYSGALGWFGFDGAADLSIVIRTAVIDAAGCSIGVGGAIVALSDPEAEIEETRLKARALIDALGGRLDE